mgnify:CR=1 FL=1|tara:strand:+ start:335 stop:724 length:390 start_codon:yes stop_codon:yes gene_type:complete
MNNAGTYGDVTWIIWAAALPYIIWFITDMICRIYEAMPSKTVYVKEYVDRPVVRTIYKKVNSPQPIVSKTKVEPKKEKETDSIILNEAVSGLVGIGVKKSEAKKMVKKLCSKESYSSAEKLLSDCFSQL